MKLSMRRSVCEKKLQFYELTDIGKLRLVKKFDGLGDRIECTFPLLDTDLTNEQRIQANLDFRLADTLPGWPLLMSANFVSGQKIDLKYMEESYPVLMPFIPTQNQIFKLIQRAAQIKMMPGENVHDVCEVELNNKE